MAEFFTPDWPAPARVRAMQTLRAGGHSPAPWASLNLGDHVGDEPGRVEANRAALRRHLPGEPLWLRQVHGHLAVDAAEASKNAEADAAFTRQADTVCVVMTADCLPVLFCDNAGTVVAAAHAGWRGLAGGILESTVAAMGVAPGELMAWLGPAIGPGNFEVGDEVRAAFLAQDPEVDTAFVARGGGKWLADIYALARHRLRAIGLSAIHGGGRCTVDEREHYFSYRRDGVTGRMATLIWLDGACA